MTKKKTSSPLEMTSRSEEDNQGHTEGFLP